MENTKLIDHSFEKDKQVKDTKIKPIHGLNFSDSAETFIESWKDDFINRMRIATGSRKRNFSYQDAVQCTSFINDPLDKIMIGFISYLNSHPLKQYDFFKYLNSYFNGKKLNPAHFRYDIDRLIKEYQKIDKEREISEKEGRKPHNKYSESQWSEYVLFVMLKLNGLYSSQYNDMFRVKTIGNREYNPAVKIPSIYKFILPFAIKEYDIKQSLMTFIFERHKMTPFDVYEKIGGDREKAKKKIATLINLHKDVEGWTYEMAINDLKKVFGDKATEILTKDHYLNRGQFFREYEEFEREQIELFVKENNLKNYIRLHDSVIVSAYENCKHLEFGKVVFTEKIPERPEVLNDSISFYSITYDEEGKTIVNTAPALYCRYFEDVGFQRISENENDELIITKNKNKVLSRFNHQTDILHYLKNDINEFDTIPVENKIAKDTHSIKAGFMLLEGKPLELHRDTKDEVFIPFKNGVAKVTKDGLTMVNYESDQIGFFVETESLKHNFEYTSSNDSVMFSFLLGAITGKIPNDLNELEKQSLNKFSKVCRIIGYLISNYKDPANAFAVILSDEGADNVLRRGGRGKSLLQTALKIMRPSIERQGDSFDTNYRHKFADLQKEHDLSIIDDVPPNFNFNSFYSEITGAITPERKGVKAEVIPFKYTPKFVLSTNYSFRLEDGETSTARRFIEIQFTDFWNYDNRPNQYFGHTFFNDWDDKEWNLFYSFMTDCVQGYLKYGIEPIEYDKDFDNYKAYFNNEIVESEFERILKICMNEPVGFTASDFLSIYNHIDNPLRFERFFHRNNVKRLVDTYIKHKNLNLEYNQSQRKWRKQGGKEEMPF